MKKFIGRLIRSAGYEIRPAGAATTDPFRQQKMLMAGISAPVIFDVGANVGTISEKYRHIFPKARIYAFEPFPGVFTKLEQRVRADTDIVTCKLALGKAPVNRALRINTLSTTNSLLETEDSAAAFWGNGLLETTATVDVEVETVDEFCRKNQIDRIDVLKIDTQGTELEVLMGAAGMLSTGRIRIVYTEIILVPTYKGQFRAHELMAFLDSFGYLLSGLYNLYSHADGRLLQMDAIFAKTE